MVMPKTLSGRTGRKKKAIEDDEPPVVPFSGAFFAHQQLNNDYYRGAGAPIQLSPVRARIENGENGAPGDWSDEDVEDSPSKAVATRGTKRRRSSNALTKDDTKRLKITGGRPALAKKVTAEMDSDDEIIFSMKNAKYLEKDIAKHLVDEGRTTYNPKTIGTRWARLKKAMQKKQDELLDADLTDWHEGDDDALHAGIDKANEYIESKIKSIKERKWRIVADYVKNIKPVTNFSQNACRNRFDALQAGTAKPVPEFVSNPSPAMQARIQARLERQQKIDSDAAALSKLATAYVGSLTNGEIDVDANIEANAWTSRQKDKFS